MANVLEQLADFATPAGVDWAVLEATLNMPREEVVYHVSNPNPDSGGLWLYQEYIQKALDRCNASLADIDMTWDVKDNPATAENEVNQAMDAWASVKKNTKAVGNKALAAIKANIAFLSEDESLHIDIETLRATISTSYMVCLYGVVTHNRGVMQLSEVAPEDIVDSADLITSTLNGLADLADMGVLNPLKRSAIGAIQPAVVIAIAAVLGIAIIAFSILSSQKQSELNALIAKVCSQAVTPAEKERCDHLIEINAVAKSPLEQAGSAVVSIGQAALMVAGAYLLIAVGVPFLRQIVNKRDQDAEWGSA